MPEPIVTAVIAAASGIVGGIIAAIARPWGQDYVNRKAEERAQRRHAAVQRVRRLERVVALLAMSGKEGPTVFAPSRGSRELPGAVAAVGDADLTSAYQRDARAEASARAGTLLREAEAEGDS